MLETQCLMHSYSTGSNIFPATARQVGRKDSRNAFNTSQRRLQECRANRLRVAAESNTESNNESNNETAPASQTE
jgi:hypothetical protein